MRTSIDLINLYPSVSLKGGVPERVWTGKDVSYDHLRVFGCKAFVHNPKDERLKLDVKAKPCIFLGYAYEEFGYRQLLFGWLYCWLNCLLNLFLAHREEKIIFRTIAFGSLSQHL